MGNKINFAWPVTTIGKYDYDALKLCVEKNKELLKEKELIIFGAGIRGTSFAMLLQKLGYNQILFTDNNEQKVGGTINGIPIIDYNDVKTHRENVVIIISVENGFAIKSQLENDEFQEGINYFYIENHLYDVYLREFLDPKYIDTLIMGDCGITDISRSDCNYTSLEEMLKLELGAERTKVLAIHAMGMRAFYHILKAHIENISIPQRAVIMANFETFTGKQHLLPRSQHAKLIEMISNAIENNDEELYEYVGITRERFQNFKVDYFASSQGTLKKMTKEKNDRIVIRMNYMYELKEDNECIVYLKKIVNLCKDKKIKLLFFIPPVNYMYAEKIYGDKFTEKYSCNVKELCRIINECGSEVLDLSYLLSEDEFADIQTIDETANYRGREKISDEIVRYIST